MPVQLPAYPLPNAATPKPLDFGGWQTAQGPGQAQRLERLGSRFAMDVTTPRLLPEPDSRIWVSRLLQGVSDTVLYPFPQPGLEIGAPGQPVIDGAGQAGQTLLIRSGQPGYFVREGQFVSLVTNGQRYLYAAIAGAAIGADGKAALTVWPPLRRSPADGDMCEIGRPMIEGALSGNEKGWTYKVARTEGLSFTITEIE